MTTVTPPPPPQPPPPSAAPPPTVVVTNPPQQLMKAALGLQLQAMVQGMADKGQVQLQSPMGQLLLQTNLALPKDAQLTLSLQSLTPQVQLQVLSINGKPPHVILGQAGQGMPAGGMPQTPGAAGPGVATGAGQGPGGLPFVSLTTGATVSGTLLKPAQGILGQAPAVQGGAQAPTAAPATPASPLGQVSTAVGLAKSVWSSAKAQIQSAVGSATGQATTGKTVTPGMAALAQGKSAGGSAAAGQAGGQAQSLPAGTQVSVRIIGIQAPAASGGPPPAPAAGTLIAAGQTLTGTVNGITASGQPIVSTPAGPIALATRSPVPMGTQVTFEVRGAPVIPADASLALASATRGDLMSARNWPALKEAVQVLQEINPQAAQQVLNTAIPRPDGGLTTTLLFFMSALRGGDVRSWLGDSAVRILEKARPGLLGRLKDEFGRRAKLNEEPAKGDWRVATVPIQNGAEIEQARLYTRTHEEEPEEDEGGAGTRFVVDVELSKLGRLQLDGLVRENNKRLDLIVRTEEPLPGEMRDHIRAIFKDAAELTGLHGGVGFQSRPPAFVEVTVDDGDAAEGLVV